MDYRGWALAGLVSGAGWRLLLTAILAASLVQLLVTTRYFATAFLLASAIALLMLDVARLIGRSRVAEEPSQNAQARRAEQELGQALALLDTITVALFALAPDGRIRFSNRAARQLCGAAVGRLEDMPGLDRAAAAAILALPVGGRRIVTLADGRSMLAWIGSFATPDEGAHKLVSLQAVAGELDAVQIGAWHAMTRVLAHEMMNSLAPIVSLSESLLRLVGSTDARPELPGAVETIARQSRHLMSFVERYRAVVNLPQPELARVDLKTFLGDIDALLGSDLRERGIAFTSELQCADRHVDADAGLLSQAISNLLINASDAVGAAGGGEVRLSCVREGGILGFEVTDNGAGVDADRLEEIFVPFFTTKQGGAGIGLTLARQIALAHGGQLTARRNSGQGMTFTLSIAALRERDEA